MQNVLPVQSAERIFILDAIRGIALCGILILNIYFFARPEPATFNLNVYQETDAADINFWYLTNFMVEGSFRALFSMLFGAGSILLVTRLEKKNPGLAPADIYYTRIIWLLVFGLINAFVLLWPGDILYSYAVCGLFIFPFRKSSVTFLLVLVVFFLSVTMLKNHLHNADRVEMHDKGLAAVALVEQKKTLSDDQKSELEAWNSYQEKHKVESLRKESDKQTSSYLKSYPEVWRFMTPINKQIESSIFYDNLFFDVILFILLGMALYKKGVLTGELPSWVYALFVVAGYALGFGWGILEGDAWRAAEFNLFIYLKIRPFPVDLYQFHRICVSIGHLGTIMLLWKSGFFNWLLRPFSSLGQMAFTNYLMQSVICSLLFYGYGLSYFGKFPRHELWYFVISIWFFQLIFSWVWLKFFLFGPLEWVWRSLTYWRIQPIKRGNRSGDN